MRWDVLFQSSVENSTLKNSPVIMQTWHSNKTLTREEKNFLPRNSRHQNSMAVSKERYLETQMFLVSIRCFLRLIRPRLVHGYNNIFQGSVTMESLDLASKRFLLVWGIPAVKYKQQRGVQEETSGRVERSMEQKIKIERLVVGHFTSRSILAVRTTVGIKKWVC